MVALLKIADEHFGPGGTERREAVRLELISEKVTPREIIRRRVEAEVEALRQQTIIQPGARSFLVDVSPLQAALNLPILKRARPPDVETEIARASAAFGRRAFIMLFDDRQVDELDVAVTVTPDSQVIFLYLTPLKGG